MDRIKAINSLVELGESFHGLKNKDALLQKAENENPWFTRENIVLAFDGIQNWLQKKSLEEFSNGYEMGATPQDVGIVMAGNIPMVGFHDLLCVLLSGHRAVIKLSSKDEVLMQAIISKLLELDADFAERIEIRERLKDIDAFIGTGSDNTNRYFEYYFGGKPHIFRRNRTSIGIVDSDTSEKDMMGLGNDIFSFYGLGCRNVSKLYIQENVELEALIEALQAFSSVAENHKYHQNYTYRKAIYLTGQTPFLDGGFFLMKKGVSPFWMIGEINYERFKGPEDILPLIQHQKGDIQTISGRKFDGIPYSEYGKTQFPKIGDFADGVDTMAFLADLR